ncbi:hypothetical protein P692DRAFT_201812620, partial [Suillus brevipes Sb2]
MPVHAFQNARTEVADFLIQNPGNFRFTTSIEDDALTLSFHSSYPPSNDFADNDNLPTPAYSPINWDELSDELTSSNGRVSQPATALQPQAVPQHSLDVLSSVSTGDPSLRGPRLTEQGAHHTGGADTLSVPTSSLGLHDDTLPNVNVMPNATHSLGAVSESSPFTNADYDYDGSLMPTTTLGWGPTYPSTINAYSLPNGNANSLPNGNAHSLLNGNAYSLLNGNAHSLPNGNAYSLPNGNAYFLPNGNACFLPNGNAYSLPIVHTVHNTHTTLNAYSFPHATSIIPE